MSASLPRFFRVPYLCCVSVPDARAEQQKPGSEAGEESTEQQTEQRQGQKEAEEEKQGHAKEKGEGSHDGTDEDESSFWRNVCARRRPAGDGGAVGAFRIPWCPSPFFFVARHAGSSKLNDVMAFADADGGAGGEIGMGMDVSSGMAVHALLQDATPSIEAHGASFTVLDVCCAPGAKLATMYDILWHRMRMDPQWRAWDVSPLVVGVDVSEERLRVCRRTVLQRHVIAPLCRKLVAEQGQRAQNVEFRPRLCVFEGDATQISNLASVSMLQDMAATFRLRIELEIEIAEAMRAYDTNMFHSNSKRHKRQNDPAAAGSPPEVDTGDTAPLPARLFLPPANKSTRGRIDRAYTATSRLWEQQGDPLAGAASTTAASSASGTSSTTARSGETVGMKGLKRSRSGGQDQQDPPSRPYIGPNGFDRVFVDAECSHDASVLRVDCIRPTDSLPSALSTSSASSCAASSTARNKPGGWDKFTDKDRIAELPHLQRRLIRAGFAALRPGGVLVYCTCSRSHQQNEDVVQWFLDQEEDAQLLPIDFGAGLAHASSPSEEEHCTEEDPFGLRSRTTVPCVPSTVLPDTVHFVSDLGTSGLFLARIRNAVPTDDDEYDVGAT